MSNLTGQSLGRYHILEQLGEGGMATVYKAYDTHLERDVAVKIIRKSAFGSEVMERMLKRFEREAKALSKLTHTNIVGVIEYGEHEGSPYLVMEYLPGGTLKQRLGKPIPWQETARLLLPIARALQFAHGQGIVHRDVKPSNILITQSGEPMLSDFGIAKIIESEETDTLTGTGVGVGTPEYMAPEQWTGTVTEQSDIYSLGVVFYEMVTGRKPYTADTPAAILLKQANEPLPRPRQYAAGLPDKVEKVLLKALARKTNDRYENMAAFASGMEQLSARQPKPKQPAAAAGVLPLKPEFMAETQGTILQEDTNAMVPDEATKEELPTSAGKAIPLKTRALAETQATVIQEQTNATYQQEATNDKLPSGKPVQPPKKKKIGWWPWLVFGGILLISGIVIAVLILTSFQAAYTPTDAYNPAEPYTPASAIRTAVPTPVRVYNFTASKNASCRAGSSTNYYIVDYLSEGQTKPIVGRNEDGSWMLLQLDANRQCWVSINVGDADGDISTLPIITSPPLNLPATDCSVYSDIRTCENNYDCKWVPYYYGDGDYCTSR